MAIQPTISMGWFLADNSGLLEQLIGIKDNSIRSILFRRRPIFLDGSRLGTGDDKRISLGIRLGSILKSWFFSENVKFILPVQSAMKNFNVFI